MSQYKYADIPHFVKHLKLKILKHFRQKDKESVCILKVQKPKSQNIHY